MTYIKQIRLENNLSRKEMAKILNIAYNHYNMCERGEYNVSLKNIKKLKEKFKNIDANKFL